MACLDFPISSFLSQPFLYYLFTKSKLRTRANTSALGIFVISVEREIPITFLATRAESPKEPIT